MNRPNKSAMPRIVAELEALQWQTGEELAALLPAISDKAFKEK